MGASGAIIAGLASFNLPFLGAVLLIRDEPGDGDIRERFSFWHEVGHTLGEELALQSMIEKGIKNPSATLALSLLLLRWTSPSAAIAAMTAVALLLLGRTYSRLRATHRLDSESDADRFAIQFMDAEDIEVLKAHIDRILPDDAGLDESQVTLRRMRFRRVLEDTQHKPPRSDLSHRAFAYDAALASLNLIGWMALLASHFRLIQESDLVLFFWAIVGVSALALISYVLSYRLRILADLVLMGSRCWCDGKFQFQRRNA
jgi:hypothetical protein